MNAPLPLGHILRWPVARLKESFKLTADWPILAD